MALTFGTFATLYWAEQYVTSGIRLSYLLQVNDDYCYSDIYIEAKGDRKSFIGCVVGVIGVTFLILPSFAIEISPSGWLVVSLLFLGEVFYASGTIYTKHVIQNLEQHLQLL